MKALLLSTALAAGSVLPALAQDAPASPFQAEAAGPSAYASDIIGARVYVSEVALDAEGYAGVQDGWQDIGEVNDVLLGRDGTVDAVLVDIGGFLGIGERQVAVDMAALKFVSDDATDADDWFLVLQTDRTTLEGAPEYVMPRPGDRADAADTDATGMENAPMASEVVGETAATPTETAGADLVEAPAVAAPALPEGYVAVGPEALTAEMLTGASVHDATDASIAEVSDLVLSADGKVTDAVLDVGGFLGIGAKSVAIPLDRLTVAQTDGGAVRIWVNMTRDELKALPEYAM